MGEYFLRLLRLRVWLAERIRPSLWQVTLIWAAVAGVCGALGSIGFRLATEGVVDSFREIPAWARLTVPAIGGLLAGAILMLGKRLAYDQTSTDYMEAIAIGSGNVPVRSSFVKIGAALFSIGSGGSIGREGPMVQLAAVLASRLGRWRHFSPPQLRLMVACGAAAGITAAYNAPIAGAFFVAEIILGSIAMDNLGPLVAASVAASLTMRTLTDVHTLYAVPKFSFGSAWEMGPYLVLGGLSGVLAPWFLRSLRWSEAFFSGLRWPAPLRLAAGGLIVGVLAIRFPEVCGNGYSIVVEILSGKIVWGALGVLMLAKWFATAASFGSGAPGGVFTPSLFMGASAGYLFGSAAHALWPNSAVNPEAFALVGMGAFLSAATHAPVMAVIMLFEMTLSYDIILPLMMCSVVAYYVAQGIERRSVYSESLQCKAAREPDPEAAIEHVAELMKPDPPSVPAQAPFQEVARLFLSGRVNNLYVVDAANRFRGVVALHDIKPYLHAPELAGLVLAGDIMTENFPCVRPRQTLEEALGAFLSVEAHRLPVVTEQAELVGSLAKTDLLLALGERLKSVKAAR